VLISDFDGLLLDEVTKIQYSLINNPVFCNGAKIDFVSMWTYFKRGASPTGEFLGFGNMVRSWLA
jgi:hypothetical protein